MIIISGPLFLRRSLLLANSVSPLSFPIVFISKPAHFPIVMGGAASRSFTILFWFRFVDCTHARICKSFASFYLIHSSISLLSSSLHLIDLTCSRVHLEGSLIRVPQYGATLSRVLWSALCLPPSRGASNPVWRLLIPDEVGLKNVG